jgi:predicted amidohydrolase
VLCEAQKPDEVIIAEIDLDLVPLQRRAVPYLRDYERETIIRALNEL